MLRDKIMKWACCAVALVAMLGLLTYAYTGPWIAARRAAELQRRAAPLQQEAATSSQPQTDETPRRASPPGGFPAVSLDFQGVLDPELVPVDQVVLEDDEVVIGVEAFGEARAYVRRAFENRPDRHIVHDELGAIPVAITHCDRTGFSRVLTDKYGESSLDLRCGGWLPEQEMSLLVGDREYAQSSRDIPLADLPFAEMTWREWREKQPDSLIYLGPLGAESN